MNVTVTIKAVLHFDKDKFDSEEDEQDYIDQWVSTLTIDDIMGSSEDSWIESHSRSD